MARLDGWPYWPFGTAHSVSGSGLLREPLDCMAVQLRLLPQTNSGLTYSTTLNVLVVSKGYSDQGSHLMIRESPTPSLQG